MGLREALACASAEAGQTPCRQDLVGPAIAAFCFERSARRAHSAELDRKRAA